MTQEAIQITETPPLPGLKLVQDTNKALQTIATDFAGSDDPAALAGPYMAWADTGNMLLKRRNAANTEWVVEGPILVEMAVKKGDASQTFKAAPSSSANEVTVQSQVFGVDQTYQIVSSSRVSGVTYTNSTGKPIVVYIRKTSGNLNDTIIGLVNASPVVTSTHPQSGNWIAVSWVVPPGLNYSAIIPQGSDQYWAEYR